MEKPVYCYEEIEKEIHYKLIDSYYFCLDSPNKDNKKSYIDCHYDIRQLEKIYVNGRRKKVLLE